MKKMVVTGLVHNIGTLNCGLAVHFLFNGDIEINAHGEEMYITASKVDGSDRLVDVATRVCDMPPALQDYIAKNKREVDIPRGVLNTEGGNR